MIESRVGKSRKESQTKGYGFCKYYFFPCVYIYYEIMLRQMRCGMGQWFLTFMGLLPLDLANKTVITILFF
jgi:hypothetical protein